MNKGGKTTMVRAPFVEGKRLLHELTFMKKDIVKWLWILKLRHPVNFRNADKSSQCHSEQPASYQFFFFKKEENETKKKEKDFGNPLKENESIKCI